ncbi:MAG TPA: PEP-utilizing enzyme, partial [Methylomirabilota bacterium]|nr:PEP-utilizing enzyme [Methylomirabilota bacterium]
MKDILQIAQGYNASPGWAEGIAVFDAVRAVDLQRSGKDVIFIRPETTPDDVHGMMIARGMITSRGGVTSHAGVVCRGLGIPCVSGAIIEIDDNQRIFSTSDRVVKEGECIIVDGSSGSIYIGDNSGSNTSDILDTHDIISIYRESRNETGPRNKTDPQIDAYLKRYISLLLSENPDDYIKDGLGLLWLLWDMVKDMSNTKIRTRIN